MPHPPHPLLTLHLIDTEINSACQFFICTDKEEFDYIVVGAGSAGSVVAHRLSEAGAHRVLLIDAGADPPLEALVS